MAAEFGIVAAAIDLVDKALGVAITIKTMCETVKENKKNCEVVKVEAESAERVLVQARECLDKLVRDKTPERWNQALQESLEKALARLEESFTAAALLVKGILAKVPKHFGPSSWGQWASTLWNAEKDSRELKAVAKGISKARKNVAEVFALDGYRQLDEIEFGLRRLRSAVARNTLTGPAPGEQERAPRLFDIKDLTFRESYPRDWGGKWWETTIEGEVFAAKIVRDEADAQEEYKTMLNVGRHPSVVALVGRCIVPEGSYHKPPGSWILVYEFMHGGNLKDRLADAELTEGICKRPLSLQERIRIAIEVARGIVFFHKREPHVVHRDIKPANVLLDDQGRARLSNFGLARAVFCTKTVTIQADTFGYLDWEMLYGDLSAYPQFDVYSFGVVLLELLSNQRVYRLGRAGPYSEPDQIHICVWAEDLLGGSSEVVDESKLRSFVKPWTESLQLRELEVVGKLGQLALKMTKRPYTERISMSEACKRLEAIAPEVPTADGAAPGRG